MATTKKTASKKPFRKPIPNPKKPKVKRAGAGGFNSDVIVDMLHMYDMPYAALNPGASYRGLHDSIVNYGGNYPHMMLCTHEETAVQIAHGYARATNTPMVAIVHNLVGLLHSNMAIYYAYIDRAPIFIIGATGPLNETRRRPKIDWIHSANGQGATIREYVKFDAQPATVDGIPESFARAFSVMMTQPNGPIYMCYDAWLQEESLERKIALPPKDAVKVPAKMSPDARELEKAAEMLVKAKNPMLLAEYAGRSVEGYDALIELANTVQAGVFDLDARCNFPGVHPLNLSMIDGVWDDVDLIVGLDVEDWERPTTKLVSTTRTLKPKTPKGCKYVDIGFGELKISGWSLDYQRLMPFSLRIIGDTDLAIPMLTAACKRLIAKGGPALKKRLKARGEKIGKKTAAAKVVWRKAGQNKKLRAMSPIPHAVLATEIWEVIKEEDWVLSAGALEDWARKIWTFDEHYRRPGKSLGTSTQIGLSLGAALANRDKGRLVVDIQPDGDLMFDAGSLWIAAKHKLPMLIVMYNNRAYYNDWEHQIRMAQLRKTSVDKAHIGMDLCDPDPDFAGLARAMGWYGEGPIDRCEDIQPALRRAIARVKAGQPALVDTITQRRDAFAT
ncbi:MAG: thiamine pyrophosphate-binding protein [Rhodospirillales bacterium]|nr:thiamine pyrophosphate-binding protein [Rhodospirillales bacterium]